MNPVLYRWDVYGYRSGRTGPGPWFTARKEKLTRAFRALRMPRERLRVRYDNGQEVVFQRRQLPPITGLHQTRPIPGTNCRIAKADAWKPDSFPGRRLAYAIFSFGLDDYYMRLFDDAMSRDFFVRRVYRYTKRRPWQTGFITFKERKS